MWDRFFSVVFCALVLLILVQDANSIAFPNKVSEPPKVECMVDGIKMTVHAHHGSPSHMFVKGRHHEHQCLTRNKDSITIQHEKCGLERERSLDPAGVFYRICIVVQMHPQFITKVDKTFCPSCFYREYVKDVERVLDVSRVPYTEVEIRVPMPTCSYAIRRGSPTGPEIRFATVGEPVYHVWSCPSDHYGMLVQNCYVDDGQGNRILIVDENGCGVDRYIVQTPNYNDELTTAFQESHVFKFADKTITRFTCSIKVCIKAGMGCKGITPPNCQSFGPGLNSHKSGSSYPAPAPSYPGPPAFKAPQYPRAKHHRAVRDLSWETGPSKIFINRTARSNPRYDEDFVFDQMDVSGELIVLDDVGMDDPEYQQFRKKHYPDEFFYSKDNGVSVCVPTIGFAALLSFTGVLLIGLIGTTALLLKFRSQRKQKHMEKESRSKSFSSGSSITTSTSNLRSHCHKH